MFILRTEDFYVVYHLKKDYFGVPKTREEFFEGIKKLDKDITVLEGFSARFMSPVFSIYDYYNRECMSERVDKLIKYINT